MHSFILYTCAIALVLVQGQEISYEEPAVPHKYTHFGHCRNAADEFMVNRKNARLMPRERQVVLNPIEGHEFTPNTVTVNRCNGYCPDRYSPMPTQTAPKSFIVHLHQRGGKMTLTNCVHVTVEEHKNCICKCMRDETYCNELQIWDGSNCKCDCKERVTKKRDCEATNEMVWNDDTCSCQCPHKIMECPHGMTWNKMKCACMRNSSD